ncbi:MAG: hypothetical protein IK085_04065 [Clostridia bacterium]|nr:hypothetical protein [Clostridia bacterium]
MFKFITTLIALFTALNSYTVTPAKDAPTKEEQHELYAEFLKEAVKTWDWGVSDDGYTLLGFFLYTDVNKTYYAYYDIDGNGVDELLVGEDGVIGVEGVSPLYIYTIEDKTIKAQSFEGYYENFFSGSYVCKNGIVVDPLGGLELSGNYYYRMECGKLTPFVCITGYNGQWDLWKFSVTFNGETTECKIPKFVANIIMNYLNKGELADINWQPMSEIAQFPVAAN